MRTSIPSLLITAVIASSAQAGHLGVIGPVYPIAEQNFLEFIRNRLLEKSRSGELQRLQDEARNRAVQSVLHPSVPSQPLRAVTARTFYFDPTFVLQHNIFDESGKVIFPAGTKANPLSITPLSRRLLFFDATDAQQVKGAKSLVDQYGVGVKPILVGGSYIELMKSWKQAVYFDQHSLLVRKLGITHVPALVSQDGLRLRIEEMVW